jgi:hypothetical protein
VLLAGPARLAAQEPVPQANATAAVSPQTTIQFPKPVPMGSSCGNWQSAPFIYTGTCGLRVRFFDAPDIHAILSNNHVLGTQGPLLCPNSATPLQTATLQPGTLDIGSIPADPTPFVVGVVLGSLPIDFSLTANNMIDAALSFTTPALADSTILNLGQPVQGFIAPAPGMAVTKTGRTTNTTTGTIQAVNTTVLVNYGAECGTARFIGQMIITNPTNNFSAAGDSGSAILQQGTNVPVGLLFAGSSTQTIANDIRVVYVLFRVLPDGTAPTSATALALNQMATASPEIARVSAIKSSVENSFFANRDVVGVGVGEGEGGGTAIVVFTRGNAALTAQALPQQVSGVPVRVVHSGAFSAYGR